MRNFRRGKGYKWEEEVHGPKGAERFASGFTVDNLDKKSYTQAQSDYERIFILVREALELNSASCMDEEEERLQCCQDIADMISQKGIIK